VAIWLARHRRLSTSRQCLWLWLRGLRHWCKRIYTDGLRSTSAVFTNKQKERIGISQLLAPSHIDRATRQCSTAGSTACCMV